MINLDKEVVIGNSTHSKRTGGTPIEDIAIFSQKVLAKMKKEKVPPTPYNFQIYFESMLEKSDEVFKADIETLRKDEANMDDDEHHIQIEKEMKEGFSSLKAMVRSISSVYKNIAMLKQYIGTKDIQVNSTNNQIAAVNIISSLKNDINRFDLLISNQLETLRQDYEKTVSSLKSMESKTIYDTRFDIYNKKYLLRSLGIEKQAISSQKYHSSLMSLKIKKSILHDGISGKNQFLLNKNIAKLLQKTSRRSDVVAHYGNGIFFMLLKHTSLEEAKLACERVSSLIYKSSFFIEGVDIKMDLEIAVSSIDTLASTEECITLLLNSMAESSRDGLRYKVIGENQTKPQIPRRDSRPKRSQRYPQNDDEESFE